MIRFTTLLIFCLTILCSAAEEYFHSSGNVYKIISEKDSTAELSECGYYADSGPSTNNLKPFVTNKETGKEYKVVSIGSRIAQGWGERELSYFTSLQIPYTVKTIKEEAFYGCRYLKDITFGGNETSIGDMAFYGCYALEILKLPDSLTEIGNSAFSDCISLGAIIIPDSVKTIGSCAFLNCTKCPTLVIGKSIRRIGESAFNWKERYIPGLYISAPCLSNIYCFAKYSPIVKAEAFNGFSYDGGAYVPKGSVEFYEQSSWWPITPIYPMPDAFCVFYKDTYTVKQGEEVELLLKTFIPGDVEIVDMKWEAFNPKAVDVKDGIAKGIKGGEMTTITLTLTDSNGNKSSANCRVEVLRVSDVESLNSDDCAKTEVYSINGLKVADSTDNLSPGIYIVKSGSQTKKISVR